MTYCWRRIINSAKLAKYINSPETEFYKKAKFCLILIKPEHQNLKLTVVIVEGYMDVISLYDKGVKNVISNSGTQLLKIKFVTLKFSLNQLYV